MMCMWTYTFWVYTYINIYILKNNNIPTYININSNHPHTIKKQLPKMISNRLSCLSSNERIFHSSIAPYQDGLTKAGYDEKLEYIKPKESKKRRRCKKVIWFNPPYSTNVRTNIGEKFLKLIDKHFKHSSLEKHLNRKSIKISYSCMPNIGTIIAGHNRKLLKNQPTQDAEKLCNCRGGLNSCPVQGKCLKKSVIYEAEVTEGNKSTKSTYIGLASNSYKERYTNHVSSFKNSAQRESTTLSKHIWSLKDKGVDHSILWRIVKTAPSYHPNIQICHLCNIEKTFILTSTHQNLLNQQTELLAKCRHRRKHLLESLVNSWLPVLQPTI